MLVIFANRLVFHRHVSIFVAVSCTPGCRQRPNQKANFCL
jgi:hypothetical protein